MSDAAFWAVCFLAIGVVVCLCVGVTALSRDVSAMDRAYRTSPGRALIRAGWRVGLFERYRRGRCTSSLKQVGHGLHLYATQYNESFLPYAEGDRGDTTVGR